nr:unnamed protein product [Digitaria exilis]CAB3505021.1 unnamed protein product [Digitaria exilis]
MKRLSPSATMQDSDMKGEEAEGSECTHVDLITGVVDGSSHRGRAGDSGILAVTVVLGTADSGVDTSCGL